MLGLQCTFSTDVKARKQEQACPHFALRALTGLPSKCSNSAVYAAADSLWIFHLCLAAGYRGIGRILALSNSHLISCCFWSSIDLDTKNPHYNVTSSALSLERDALGFLYPDIADAPDVRQDYVMDEADYSNPFPDLGQSSRVIVRYSPHLVSRSGQMDPSSPPTRMVACLSRLDSRLQPSPSRTRWS
jgi:hypothetical protein